jgi:hypothetical protein
MANESNPKVSLGCGTLILIALIVLFLGNSNNDDKIVNEIRDLKQQINRLEDQVKNQSETIRELSSQHSEQRQPRQRIVLPATPELEMQDLPEN